MKRKEAPTEDCLPVKKDLRLTEKVNVDDSCGDSSDNEEPTQNKDVKTRYEELLSRKEETFTLIVQGSDEYDGMTLYYIPDALIDTANEWRPMLEDVCKEGGPESKFWDTVSLNLSDDNDCWNRYGFRSYEMRGRPVTGIRISHVYVWADFC